MILLKYGLKPVALDLTMRRVPALIYLKCTHVVEFCADISAGIILFKHVQSPKTNYKFSVFNKGVIIV